MKSPIERLTDQLDYVNNEIVNNLERQKTLAIELEQEKVLLQQLYTAKRNFENAIEILKSTDSE